MENARRDKLLVATNQIRLFPRLIFHALIIGDGPNPERHLLIKFKITFGSKEKRYF